MTRLLIGVVVPSCLFRFSRSSGWCHRVPRFCLCSTGSSRERYRFPPVCPPGQDAVVAIMDSASWCPPTPPLLPRLQAVCVASSSSSSSSSVLRNSCRQLPRVRVFFICILDLVIKVPSNQNPSTDGVIPPPHSLSQFVNGRTLWTIFESDLPHHPMDTPRANYQSF